MRNQTVLPCEGDLWKGMIAGIAGGVAASFVMNQFQKLWQKYPEGTEHGHGAQSKQKGSPRRGAGSYLEEKGIDKPDDNAAERTANVISVGVFDRKLTESEKEKGGVFFHYMFGIVSGAAYGAAAEMLPGVTAGAGLPFGAVVWVTADEGVVPLLGLSKMPDEYSPSTHAFDLASHLVYGLTTELVRNSVRKML